MNLPDEPSGAPSARPASATLASRDRSVVRAVVWVGLFVAALTLILLNGLPLPPPTIETFAAVIVMAFSIVGILSLTRATAPKSGMVAYALVIAIGAAALRWLPQWSGIIAAGALAVLVVVPLRLIALSRRCALAGSRRAAAICWDVASCLHPSAAMRFYGALLRARAQRSSDAETAAYAALKQAATAPATVALLDSLTALARDDWTGVLDHSRDAPALKGYEVRALGELGRVDDMVAAYAAWHPKPRGGELDLYRLVVLAFAGRVDGVRALLATRLRSLRPERAAYWSFVATTAAGVAEDSPGALARHADASDDEAFRRAARRHLAAAAPSVRPPALSANSTAVIAEIETAAGRPKR